jgi:hypothetical protein
MVGTFNLHRVTESTETWLFVMVTSNSLALLRPEQLFHQPNNWSQLFFSALLQGRLPSFPGIVLKQ